MAPLRLFLALETPGEVRTQIEKIIGDLRSAGAQVSWEPQEKLHATMKFLGPTAEEKIPGICSLLGRICGGLSPAIAVRYAGAGVFPDHRRPRVVWIGMDDMTGAMTTLHTRVDDAMATIGFGRDERAFHPHVTIGRVKGERGLKRLLEKLETITFQSDQVVIGELALVKSTLTPEGSVYSVLERFSFGT
jgi:2'-5' RNA ligase